jgi:hypothetical protein
VKASDLLYHTAWLAVLLLTCVGLENQETLSYVQYGLIVALICTLLMWLCTRFFPNARGSHPSVLGLIALAVTTPLPLFF